MTEKAFTGQLDDYIVEEHDKVIRYYLLLKQPLIKEIRLTNPQDYITELDERDRAHIKSLLMDSESISQFRPLIKDPNSIS